MASGKIREAPAAFRRCNHFNPLNSNGLLGSRYLDPRTEPWQNVVKVIYLDEAMQTLAETQPNHFLISLFRPLVEPEKSVVEKLAQEDYHRLKAVHVEDSQPAGLEAIFLDWLMQLFKTKTRSEIAKMIAELTPIEETVAGRELIAIGEERGMERGMEQLILQQISERFGRVSLETQKGIAALPVKHLPELGRALLRFPDVAALESWLRLRLGN